MEIDRRILIAVLSGEATPAEKLQLDEWRAERPEHEVEFQRQARMWELVGVLADVEGLEPKPRPIRWRAANRASGSGRGAWRSRQRLPEWTGLVAASLLLGLLIGVLGPDWRGGDGLGANDVVTGRGEIATLTLRDGTVVRLGPESRLGFTNVSGPRDVRLDGQAFFAVPTGGKAPFRVHTAAGDVTVLGTRFDVRSRGSEVDVIVVEGEVVMDAGHDELSVSRGQMGRLGDEEPPEVVTVDDVYAATQWIGPFIAYETTPLREVAEEFRGRLGIDLRIADEALAARTVTGWFRDQTPAEMISSICLAVDAECRWDGEGVVSMTMEANPASPADSGPPVGE